MVLLVPLVVVVIGFRILQLVQENFVLVNDSSQTSDPICSIQGRVGVQTIWLRTGSVCGHRLA